MFLITSNRFRQATKDRIFFWRKSNQVVPSQQRATRMATLDARTKN